MSKELLFSVTINDCEVQTFRCGGKGGQNVNKLETGVRIIHKASGARGESREHRSQWPNKQAAFKRMAETVEFKCWHKIETARRLGQLSNTTLIEAYELNPRHIKVEVQDRDGRWVEEVI